MPIPKGFLDLVKLAMNDRPDKPKTVDDIWDKFLKIIFMGGKRSDPEVKFLISMLKPKKVLDLDYLKKTDGDDWQIEVENIFKERILKIKDDDILLMLKELQKDLFRITASIKGSARFFDKNGINPEYLETTLSTREKTWQFIEDLATNEDVSNIKYTKIIIWLHSIGFGYDFCPPTWQVKKFVNEDIGPYYQFYEDDKYFMKKAQEFTEEVRKKQKKATARDVSAAIFYYMVMKNMLASRSIEKKKFNCTILIKFLKARKLSLSKLSGMLSDLDDREKLVMEFGEFVHKNI